MGTKADTRPDPGRGLREAFAALTDRDHHDVFPNGRAGKLAPPEATTEQDQSNELNSR